MAEDVNRARRGEREPRDEGGRETGRRDTDERCQGLPATDRDGESDEGEGEREQTEPRRTRGRLSE
jgi:hypothetical protein